MIRLVIFIAVLLIFAAAFTWLYRAFRAYREGTLEPTVPGAVREQTRDRYEIVESKVDDILTIAVVDPNGREIKAWTVDMTSDTAADDLLMTRADARALHGELDV